MGKCLNDSSEIDGLILFLTRMQEGYQSERIWEKIELEGDFSANHYGLYFLGNNRFYGDFGNEYV